MALMGRLTILRDRYQRKVRSMRLIRLPEVLMKTGFSRSRLYADDTFPQRVRLGKRGVAWVEAEIDEWIQKRMEDRE